MKKFKLIAIALSVILLVSLASCNGDYKLTIDGDKSLLVNRVKDYYNAGDEIILQVAILYDASVEIYLNGENIGDGISIKNQDGRYSHNEFRFTMPAKESVIKLEVKEGFLVK